ncbi:MAG TPA: cytochrome c-type biogenesis protein CcmH [Vicinamibacteria bacterium]|nr:cytochrome c-type biogenesis protein CcmH [Vicinamibacteria bacterium]
MSRRLRLGAVVGRALVASLGLVILPPAAADEPMAAAGPSAATADPSRVVGPPRGPALAGEALLARTEEVASLLRCPVCQGLSVADSPATMAVSMKAQVKEMLGAGYEEEQILSYFENSYGEFVRLRPPLRGVNWLVWLAPLLGLLAGGAVVAWALRSPARAAAASPPPDTEGALDAGRAPEDRPGPDTLPDDPALARHVLRVRELAYGWPGGRSPAAGAAPTDSR